MPKGKKSGKRNIVFRLRRAYIKKTIMWRLLRNLQIDENEEAVNSLERYFSVLKNKLPAKFRISKKIPVETELNSDKDELWEAHRAGVKKFRGKLEEIDEGKTELGELETPKTRSWI